MALSRLLSLTCQSMVAPQKPVSEPLLVSTVPSSLVLRGVAPRASYIAKKNSLSLTIGPDT